MSTPPLDLALATRAHRRRRRTIFLLLLVGIALTLSEGARRRPANPTRPLELRGETPLESRQGSVLRVASFNIHSARGTDRRRDIVRTAAVFPGKFDLVGLNEVQGTFDAAFGPDQAQQLGDLLGMRSSFIATESRWWHDHFGNGLLSRHPVRHLQRIPLAGLRDKAFRTAVLAQVLWHETQVQLLIAHVDSQSDRSRQLDAVLALFLGLQPPAVLMGDLNTSREDPALQRLLTRPDVVGSTSETLRDGRGRAPIDWILARGFRCRTCEVLDTDASDHPAVVADLELLPTRAETDETALERP